MVCSGCVCMVEVSQKQQHAETTSVRSFFPQFDLISTATGASNRWTNTKHPRQCAKKTIVGLQFAESIASNKVSFRSSIMANQQIDCLGQVLEIDLLLLLGRLTKASHFNGRRGVVLSSCLSQGRVSVQFFPKSTRKSLDRT